MMSTAPFTECPECNATVDPEPCRLVTYVEWSSGEWTPDGFAPSLPLNESGEVESVGSWYLACRNGHRLRLPVDTIAQLLA